MVVVVVLYPILLLIDAVYIPHFINTVDKLSDDTPGCLQLHTTTSATFQRALVTYSARSLIAGLC